MRPEWISGTELLDRWKIKGIELCSIVQEGLQPYTELGELKPSPDVTEKRERLKEVRKKLAENEETPIYGLLKYDDKLGQYCPAEDEDSLHDLFREERESLNKEADELESNIENADASWRAYKLPDDKDSAIAVVNALVKSLFMLEDVDVHDKEQDFKESPKTANRNIVKQTSNESTADNQLIWNGKSWQVTFGGCKVQETFDELGLTAIAYIIG